MALIHNMSHTSHNKVWIPHRQMHKVTNLRIDYPMNESSIYCLHTYECCHANMGQCKATNQQLPLPVDIFKLLENLFTHCMEFLECDDDEWQETEIETEQGTFGFDTARQAQWSNHMWVCLFRYSTRSFLPKNFLVNMTLEMRKFERPLRSNVSRISYVYLSCFCSF